MLKAKALNAPVIGKDPIEDVIAYIDKYISTYLPSHEEDPELHELVSTLQTHGHIESYCGYSLKNGTPCRFGFPKILSPSTKMTLKQKKSKNNKTACGDDVLSSHKPTCKDNLGNQESPHDDVHDESSSDPDAGSHKKHSMRSKDIIYARQPGSEMVNTYNPTLLRATRSNMDACN